MKLSDYAKKVGVSYITAYRWFKAGQVKGYQMDTGTIVITESDNKTSPQKVAIYARVASNELKDNLDRQANRLIDYCNAKGWRVEQVIKDIGSGVNDNRQKLIKLLSDPTVTIIVVEHQDRLTRFGFNYIETLLTLQGRQVEVVNPAEDGQEELLSDLGSIIYSFCVRLYGLRRAKQKTERITQELQADD